jgi:hypothetical protein
MDAFNTQVRSGSGVLESQQVDGGSALFTLRF